MNGQLPLPFGPTHVVRPRMMRADQHFAAYCEFMRRAREQRREFERAGRAHRRWLRANQLCLPFSS